MLEHRRTAARSLGAVQSARPSGRGAARVHPHQDPHLPRSRLCLQGVRQRDHAWRPHLSPERTAQLNAQAAHNIACIQGWIDRGPDGPIDPSHLLFSIWAATQTYADFDWQISTVTGKARLDEADYDAAADTIIRTVLRGCEIAEPTAA